MRASRVKRSTARAVSPSSGGSTLRATTRRSPTSIALNTTAIPPRASSCSTSYSPASTMRRRCSRSSPVSGDTTRVDHDAERHRAVPVEDRVPHIDDGHGLGPRGAKHVREPARQRDHRARHGQPDPHDWARWNHDHNTRSKTGNKMGGTTRIAIRRHRGPPVNRLRSRRLSPLPRRGRPVTSCGSRNTTPAPQRSNPMRFAPSLAVAALAVFATPLAAQETPTERSAAADVVRRMNTLERSLALPALVARLTGARDPRRDAVLARAKALMDQELLAMADDITHHPETGYKEERSVKILTDYLQAHDFDVTTGVAGLKTAFVARYKKGTPGPNLGVILEYDALRGTTRDFHGDQHSAQGPVGMAAALAVAEFLTASKTPGTVTVYGTPAEEIGSPEAKTTMYQAGVFKGADVLVRSHSSTATQAPGPGFGSCCMNIDVVRYIFSGAPAHQLQAWDGRDALTGVIELFNHIDAIRRTLRPETRIQGIITEGGKAPNVVPDRAVAEFWLRYPDQVYLAQVLERVDDAARAAALATGTKVRIEADSESRDGISVAALNDVAFAYLKQL